MGIPEYRRGGTFFYCAWRRTVKPGEVHWCSARRRTLKSFRRHWRRAHKW